MSGWMNMITTSGGSTGGGSADQTATGLGNILGSLSAYGQNKNTAKLMREYRNNALREAENAAANKRREYERLAGSQKAGIGASGVDVNEGSAVEALAATDAEGEVGAKLIAHAGELEALNWKIRENAAKQKQRMALINAAVVGTDPWRKGGQQKFWDGFRSSGGGKTLGDM